MNTEHLDSSMIQGKWYNKRTNETVVVRDAIMDGDDMKVLCQDGNIIDGEEFSRDFIQCDSGVFDSDGNKVDTVPEIDYDLMFKNNTEQAENLVEFQQPQLMKIEEPVSCKSPQQNINVNDIAINKVFSKLSENALILKSNIEFNDSCESDINQFKTDLKTIKDIFNISEDDIAVYIYNTYFTKENVIESIKMQLKNFI